MDVNPNGLSVPKPCDLVRFYEQVTSRIIDLQLMRQQNQLADTILSPKYAVIYLIDSNLYYPEKMWHCALWGLAVDMANRSTLKKDIKNDPNYQQILDITSQILLAASEKDIRDNLPTFKNSSV